MGTATVQIVQLCNVYINQQDAQILVNNLYFFVKSLYMFRTNGSTCFGLSLVRNM